MTLGRPRGCWMMANRSVAAVVSRAGVTVGKHVELDERVVGLSSDCSMTVPSVTSGSPSGCVLEVEDQQRPGLQARHSGPRSPPPVPRSLQSAFRCSAVDQHDRVFAGLGDVGELALVAVDGGEVGRRAALREACAPPAASSSRRPGRDPRRIPAARPSHRPNAKDNAAARMEPLQAMRAGPWGRGASLSRGSSAR